MWKSTEYCDYSATWACDHDLSYVSTYTVLNTVDEWTGNDPDEGTDIVCSNSVTCTRDCHSCTLQINIHTKAHYNFSVVGLHILSEARTIELYSDSEGYLQTGRGVKRMVQQGDGSSELKMFDCVLKLEQPVEQLMLKFVGLAELTSIQINKLHLILVQHEGNSGSTVTTPGMIDMSKVRGYLHTMGDKVPEQGTRLMKAVEEYQQTQMGRFSSMIGCGDNGALSDLLSMVTRSHGNEEANQQDSHKPQEQNSIATGLTMPRNEHEPSKAGPLAAMLMSMSRSQGQGDSEGQAGMFAMLKDICGKVSEMRAAEHKPVTESEVETEKSGGRVDTLDDLQKTRVEESPDVGASNGETVSSRMTGSQFELLETTMTQTVSQMMQNSEEKLMKYIDTRLLEMEARLSQKLDKLVKLLEEKQTTTDKENAAES